ncbi:MAG: DUF3137 domain-containing protein [Planctomycetes bacterium]|nr:DUF3137 domain-containing protein [Planctomycetota bacterium]
MLAKITPDFAHFVHEKLRPAAETVTAKKRSTMFFSLAMAGAVFLVCGAIMYFMMAPYRQMLGEYNITHWPLMIIAPLAMAMIGFCVVYIVGLRRIVGEFRTTLVSRMAEYIDPILVYEANRKVAASAVQDSLVFPKTVTAKPGNDYFRGRIEDSPIELGTIQAAPTEKGGTTRNGVILLASLPKRFKEPLVIVPMGEKVSRSALEEDLEKDGIAVADGLVRLEDAATSSQILLPSADKETGARILSPETLRRLLLAEKEKDVDFYLSCKGDRLAVALLSPEKRLDFPNLFEGFNFADCQEFCHDAKLVIAVCREIVTRTDLFTTERSTTTVAGK